MLLSSASIDVDCLDGSGHTALSIASSEENVECMEMLIAHGASVNKSARWDESSPLIVAIEKRRKKAVKLLIAANADLWSRNNNAFTCAVKSDDVGIVKLIYEYLQTLNWKSSDIESFVNKGLKMGKKASRRRLSPLHLACEQGNEDMVQYLIQVVRIKIRKTTKAE